MGTDGKGEERPRRGGLAGPRALAGRVALRKEDLLPLLLCGAGSGPMQHFWEMREDCVLVYSMDRSRLMEKGGRYLLLARSCARGQVLFSLRHSTGWTI